jgi:hypothetical protein
VTVLQPIITQGYRELNLLAIGKSPSTNQNDEGLLILQNIIETTVTGDAGEVLKDWPLGNFDRQTRDRINLPNQYFANPPINSRLVAVNDAAMTVFLPPRPSDGSLVAIVDPFMRLAASPVTLDGNGRTIEGAQSVVANTNDLNRIWFYRADLGNWQRLTELGLTDEMPFPKKYDFYFSIGLALRLAGRTGRRASEMTVAAYSKLRTQFVAQYLQSEAMARNRDLCSDYMSVQSYDTYGDTTDNNFVRGQPRWP